MKLNDVVVRTLLPRTKGQKTYYDDVLPNFGMRVSQGGTRTFIVRHGHERHLITLGRYPLISTAAAEAFSHPFRCRAKGAMVGLPSRNAPVRHHCTIAYSYGHEEG